MRTPATLLALAVLGSACLAPPDAVPSLQAGIEFATQYNRRGMVQSDKPVLQPHLATDVPTVFGGVIGARGRGNLELSDTTGNAWFPDGYDGEFSAIELTAFHWRRWAGIDWTTGITSYNLPNGDEFPFGARDSTAELFLGAAGEVAGFEPSITLHYDFDEADSLYSNGAVARTFELTETTRAEAAVSVGLSGSGHSEWAYNVRETGFSDLRGTLRLTHDLDEFTVLGVGVAVSTILDSGIEDWFDDNGVDADNVWATAGISWSF